MSKNTKYSNLPNIASDQVDVYETNCQPEPDPQATTEKRLANLNANKFIKQEFNQSLLEQADSTSDNIDSINIKPKDAYARFKGTCCSGRLCKRCTALDQAEPFMSTCIIRSLSRSKDKYLPSFGFNESQLTYQKFGEWQLVDRTSEETPYQKYCRLKSEVSELASQLRCVDGNFDLELSETAVQTGYLD